MIPKKIHYIWLGGKPFPKLVTKCINSWRKFCPDYEIIRWDESNINLDCCSYCRKAYDAKKFAFASDALRFHILKEHGGIYLDIDVELIKNLNNLLNSPAFCGFENEKYVAPGLIFGSEQNGKVVDDMIKYYSTLEFEDYKDDRNLLTICAIVTEYLKEKGLQFSGQIETLEDIVVYPKDYFCPKSMSDGKIRKTSNTYAIHHYLSSWATKRSKLKTKFIQLIKRIIGEKNVQKLKDIKEKKNKDKDNDESKD